MDRVKNKIALITGGAEGIGESIARLLADEGAFVIITDIIDDSGKKLAKNIGEKASYYHLEVSQEHEWKHTANLIKHRFGKLDILVNNAGIMGLTSDFGPQDPEYASLESWHRIHAVNLDGVFLGCKYAIPLMKESGGAIVNISSRSGIVGVSGAAAYASSKAAVRNHTKTVALYCAEQRYNIRCNSILPAAILTPLWEPMLGNDHKDRQNMIKKIERDIPLRKMGEPIDIAYAVLYLASDESKYVTGTELIIDGGILAGSIASPKPK
ncbi:MAG: glucose 1-dehydrogenase [Alphaproteobacteria bacterium]|nr:glucose 1-dehydrogenase [Alphaproteobacteria bacterium]